MKIKFTLVLIVLASALTVIGYYGQGALSQLILSIKEESRPNYRLSLLQDISSSLLVGENSINRFSITKIPNDLDNYYKTVTTIDAKLDSFTSLSDQVLHLDEVLQLNQLIEQKLVISSELIELKDKENTTIAFNRIVHAIQKKEMEMKESLSMAEIKEESDSVESIITTPDKEIQSEVSVVQKPRRNNIFKKIFGRKNKVDTNLLQEEIDPVVLEPVDSAFTPIAAVSTSVDSSYTEIIKDIITRIGNEERDFNRKLSKQELSLLIRDKEISDQLNTLIEQISAAEQIVSDNRANAAKALTIKTQNIITSTIGFSMLFVCLLLGIIFFDLSRLKKNRKELKKAKEEAEKSAQAKQEFLATMSHEIRTPLTAIIGFTEQLDREITLEKRSQFIQIIRNSSEYLLNIVNDILDFARLESDTIKTDSIIFRPDDVVNEVIGLFDAQAVNAGLELSAESHLEYESLRGDAFRYKQIVINLVSNALKFTKEGSIIVKLQLIKEGSGTTLSTIVRDTGIGIASDRIEHIFDRFEQADKSTTRHFGGTGLGLSIVKKLVDLLGGEININSELVSGTTFEVLIPFEQVSEKDPISTTNIARTGLNFNGKKVLVVDDEKYNLELNRVILEQAGFEVTLIEDSTQGLNMIKNTPYDLAILDIHMPGLSGLEMAQQIRNWDSPRHLLPLIASTATTLTDSIESIRKAGFNSWISKPFTQEELIAAVSQILVETTAEQESHGEQLDSLNIDELLEISQGNIDFVLNMLKLYLSSTEDNFHQLDQAMTANNRKEIEHVAHKMVSPTRHLNLTYFTNTLKKIELLAQEEKDFDMIQDQHQKALKMWGRITPFIKMKIEELEKSAVSV